jgi:hypothetical protein
MLYQFIREKLKWLRKIHTKYNLMINVAIVVLVIICIL